MAKLPIAAQAPLEAVLLSVISMILLLLEASNSGVWRETLRRIQRDGLRAYAQYGYGTPRTWRGSALRLFPPARFVSPCLSPEPASAARCRAPLVCLHSYRLDGFPRLVSV